MTGALGPRGDRWRKYRGQKHAQSTSSYKGSIPAIRRLGLGSTGRCFALKWDFLQRCNYNNYDSMPSSLPWLPGCLRRATVVLQQNEHTWKWFLGASKVLLAQAVVVGPGGCPIAGCRLFWSPGVESSGLAAAEAPGPRPHVHGSIGSCWFSPSAGGVATCGRPSVQSCGRREASPIGDSGACQRRLGWGWILDPSGQGL